MQQIEIVRKAYRRTAAQSPVLRLENYYIEQSPLSQSGLIWIPRPSLKLFVSGNDKLRGLFRETGVLNGDLIRVHGINVERITIDGLTTNIGTIGGSDFVSIAGSLAGIMIADGNKLWYSTGGSLTEISIPFTNPIWVGFLDGYWHCISGDTQKRYWAADINPTTWDALDYDAASSRADPLIGAAITNGRLWDFGANSVEFRYATGDANAPFAVEQGRAYQRGCLTKNAIVPLDNTIVWVGEDRIIYRGGEVPQAISDAFLSELLSKVEVYEIYATGLNWQGHVFFVLTIGNEGTFVYDLITGTWSEWITHNQDKWLAGLSCSGWDSSPIVGNVETGTLYTLDDSTFSDDGLEMVGVLTMGFPIKGARQSVNLLRIEMATGHGLQNNFNESGVVELRTSKNEGNTWGDWIEAGLGKAGEFNKRVLFRRLGQFQPSGFLAELRISDNTPRRVTGAYIDGAF